MSVVLFSLLIADNQYTVHPTRPHTVSLSATILINCSDVNMSADAADQAATHENPEPRDPFFPFTDVDPLSFITETFKTF